MRNRVRVQGPCSLVGETDEFTGMNCLELGEPPAAINNLPHVRKLKGVRV